MVDGGAGVVTLAAAGVKVQEPELLKVMSSIAISPVYDLPRIASSRICGKGSRHKIQTPPSLTISCEQKNTNILKILFLGVLVGVVFASNKL